MTLEFQESQHELGQTVVKDAFRSVMSNPSPVVSRYDTHHSNVAEVAHGRTRGLTLCLSAVCMCPSTCLQ